MYKFIIFFFIFCFFSWSAVAQMPPAGSMPPMFMGKGFIEGTLYKMEKGKKQVLTDHPIGIMVFQNGQRLLTLDKKTDANGNFKFKNIKQEDGFSYVLGVIENDKLYVMSDITLTPAQDVFKADFNVGEGSPYLMEDVDLHAAQAEANAESASPNEADTPAMTGQMGSGESSKSALSVASPWEKPHQKLAILLSVFVLGLSFYFFNTDPQG
ncbi:hypothetical protein K1X76_11080 [bacterium]|nr:hypothetical protein [bacterium]